VSEIGELMPATARILGNYSPARMSLPRARLGFLRAPAILLHRHCRLQRHRVWLQLARLDRHGFRGGSVSRIAHCAANGPWPVETVIGSR
jgi:hypothetical protein